MTLNEINQDSKYVLEYDINKTVNFNRLKGSMEEVVVTFKSMVRENQRNGGP